MIRGGWHLFLTIFCLFASADQLKNLIVACQHNTARYTVICDAQLSDLARQEIEHEIKKYTYKAIAPALTKFKEKYRYIDTITAQAHPDGNVIVRVNAARPKLIVNSDYLLTANNTITYLNRYTHNNAASLPCLYYPGNNPIESPELVLQAAQIIDFKILKKYDVSLFSQEDIRLTPIDNPLITLTCCLKKFPNEDLLLQSCSICSQELQQLEHGSVMADLRFKNQIVVTKKG